jgi:hypothetical protein
MKKRGEKQEETNQRKGKVEGRRLKIEEIGINN